MADFVMSKPVIAAVVGGVTIGVQSDVFHISGGNPIARAFGGPKTMSMPVLGAILGFSSSFLVEAVNSIVHAVDKKHRLNHFESFVTHLSAGFLMFLVLPSILSYGGLSFREVLAIGVAGIVTEITSQWFYEKFIVDGTFRKELFEEFS